MKELLLQAVSDVEATSSLIESTESVQSYQDTFTLEESDRQQWEGSKRCETFAVEQHAIVEEQEETMGGEEEEADMEDQGEVEDRKWEEVQEEKQIEEGQEEVEDFWAVISGSLDGETINERKCEKTTVEGFMKQDEADDTLSELVINKTADPFESGSGDDESFEAITALPYLLSGELFPDQSSVATDCGIVESISGEEEDVDFWAKLQEETYEHHSSPGNKVQESEEPTDTNSWSFLGFDDILSGNKSQTALSYCDEMECKPKVDLFDVLDYLDGVFIWKESTNDYGNFEGLCDSAELSSVNHFDQTNAAVNTKSSIDLEVSQELPGEEKKSLHHFVVHNSDFHETSNQEVLSQMEISESSEGDDVVSAAEDNENEVYFQQNDEKQNSSDDPEIAYSDDILIQKYAENEAQMIEYSLDKIHDVPSVQRPGPRPSLIPKPKKQALPRPKSTPADLSRRNNAPDPMDASPHSGSGRQRSQRGSKRGRGSLPFVSNEHVRARLSISFPALTFP